MDVYLLISALFSVGYALLLIRFLAGWFRLKNPKPLTSDALPGVTIILPVRNEELHISSCIESLLQQDYPRHLMEIIVLNDYSTDDTLYKLRELESRGILVLDLKNYLGEAGEKTPNKKKAIALGVKNATYDILLTTDGDTTRSPLWLKTMVSAFCTGKYKLATAPVLIRSGWNPLSWFQQADQLNMTAITASGIALNSPVMCNGANLIYTRQAFQEVQGFRGNEDVPGGDDYFLMEKLHRQFPGSIGYIKSTDAVVITEPAIGLFSFFEQRTRWVSKLSNHVFNRAKMILGFAWLFNLYILVVAIMAFRNEPFAWLPLAVVLSVKLFFDFVFNVAIMQFFRQWMLLPLFPVIELFHIIYVFLTGLSATGGKYRWKGRNINRSH
jgi:cellulose synthase/poly-beta-1,6-N-acetylglucosamine synthase-like glycosyltransferase